MDSDGTVLQILEPVPDARGERALQVPRIVDAAPRQRYASEVPAQFRVLYALLREADRDAVEVCPGWQRDPVPPETYVLTERQTALKVKVRGTRKAGTDLVLDLAAWFPHVDLVEPQLSVKTDGDLVEVTPGGDPIVVASRQGAERRYPGSGWTVTVKGAARRAPQR